MPIPKGCRWGVDSFMRITESLFNFVVAKTKAVPAFWGRYIGKKDSNLQKDEIDFLRRVSPGTRLLVIYNGFFDFVEDKPHNSLTEYNKGKAVARGAISAATAIQVPAGVCIYVNMEPPPHGKASADCIRGW